MKNETKHVFKVMDISESNYTGNGVFPNVEMSISGEAGLSDMLEAFQNFLNAIGYVTPANTCLDFVSLDDGEDY